MFEKRKLKNRGQIATDSIRYVSIVVVVPALSDRGRCLIEVQQKKKYSTVEERLNQIRKLF